MTIRMRKILKKWWEGTYVPPPKNDPHSIVFIISAGRYKRSPSSRAAHAIKDFWLKYWQWCFTAAFSMAGLIIAALKL